MRGVQGPAVVLPEQGVVAMIDLAYCSGLYLLMKKNYDWDVKLFV
jgi:hypothetical protein